jgi:hypothetical protein
MLEKEIVEAKARDAFVESILFTQFADKTTILKKSGSFSWSRSEFERDLKSIQKLRDALAHANEYANSHESALRVCKTVRLIDLWKGRLVAWQIRNAAVETLGREDAELGFRQIEPTAVLGGVMPFEPLD